MGKKEKFDQKRCAFCGQFFRPSKRVGNRQKSCKSAECQRKRRQAQQQRWRETNPDYFRGRYGYLKQWRKENPDYQKRWRAGDTDKKPDEIQTLVPHVTPISTIRLNIRANRLPCEIQTLVLTLVKAGQALWVDGARMHPG